ALHVARCTTHEKGEGFSAVGGIQGETMLRREPSGRLPLRRRVAVARPQPVHYDQRDAGCGMWDADVVTREEPPCGVREPRRPPAAGDEDRRDADAHDPGRPAERGDGEGE